MIRANGVRIALDDRGAGPAIVLVHGSWTDRRAWDAVSPQLVSAGLRTVRYDRRGHGQSEAAGGTLDDDAADLGGLIEALGIAPAHVVGSSRGGTVALKLAASRPELMQSMSCHEPPVAGLVPAGHPRRAEIDAVLEAERSVCRLIERGEAARAAEIFVDRVAFGEGGWRRLPQSTREAFVANASTFVEECADPQAHQLDLEALRAFSRPVLLTRGGLSPAWYGAIIEVLHESLPRSRTHLFRHAGHVPQATTVGEFVRTISEFVRQAEA